MKLNKSIICLVICLIFLAIQVDARKVKRAHQKLQYKTVFQDWNSVQVSVRGKSNYVFEGKLKDAVLNNAPMGVIFDALEQISENDQSGYVQYAQDVVKLSNNDVPRAMIDYRQIKNCVFNDNAGLRGGKNLILEFDLSFDEEYNVLNSAQQNFGNNLRMQFSFPNITRPQFFTYKEKIQNNCLLRNTQMNKLKEAALNSGNQYYSLYFEYQNRQVSIEDRMNQQIKQGTVVAEIQKEEVLKALEFQKVIAQNEQSLKDLQKTLLEIGTNKADSEAEVERLNEQLTQLKVKVSDLQNAQGLVKKGVVRSQSQLSETIAARDKLNKAAVSLEQKKKNQEAQAKKQQKEFEKTQAEIKARLEAAQKAYEAKKAQNDKAAAVLAAQTAANKDQQKNIVQTIDSLNADITKQAQQIKDMDNQISQIDQAAKQLQENINQRRGLAAQLNAQIKQLQSESEARAARMQQIDAENKKVLAELKQKQQANLELLISMNKTTAEKLAYYQKQASVDIEKWQGSFMKALQNIVDVASAASHRTVRAAQTVLLNQHLVHLQGVVSSTDTLIKKAFMRQAKQQQERNRLARLRQKQVKLVRLQRNKLKKRMQRKLAKKKALRKNKSKSVQHRLRRNRD